MRVEDEFRDRHGNAGLAASTATYCDRRARGELEREAVVRAFRRDVNRLQGDSGNRDGNQPPTSISMLLSRVEMMERMRAGDFIPPRINPKCNASTVAKIPRFCVTSTSTGTINVVCLVTFADCILRLQHGD